MSKTIILLILFLLIISLIWGFPTFKKLRRSYIKNKPFPLHWVSFIEQNIAIYKRLPKFLQKRLHGKIAIFIAEKQFQGCRGLQITDEIKIIIAAQACLLLLNRRENYYPNLYSILIYPSAYIVKTQTPIGNYLVEEKQEVRIGESWNKGQIVLSWEQIKRDTMNWRDGHNVVIHEFAHQLDQEDGSLNGVPYLEKQSDYLTWGRVWRDEYQKFCRQVEQGLKTVIDEYGATNPAEFFAVATETFFEKPKQMKSSHPALYHELKRYYKLDPSEWI